MPPQATPTDIDFLRSPSKPELDFQPSQEDYSKATFTGETGRAAKQFGRGALELGKNVALAPFDVFQPPSRAKAAPEVGRAALSGFTEPLKEITRPGDIPLAERGGMAVLNFLGVDTDRAYEFAKRNQYGAFAGAVLTPLLLNYGVTRVAADLLGRRLRPSEERATKLHYFIGQEGNKEDILGAIRRVQPELDKTARQTGMFDKLPLDAGKVGKVVFDSIGATKRRLDAEFNLALKGTTGGGGVPLENKLLPTDEVAKAVREQKRQFPVTKDDEAFNKRIEELATEYDTYIPPAPQYKNITALGKNGKPLVGPNGQPITTRQLVPAPPPPPPKTFGWVNQERKRLYEMRKDTAAYRLQVRTSADAAGERAAEDALRDLLYDGMGKETGRGDYWANLKRTQHDLISLEDRMRERVNELQKITTEWKASPSHKKIRFSLYGHPLGETGGTFHPDPNFFTGGPNIAARSQMREAMTPRPPKGAGGKARAAARVVLGRTPREGREEEK